MPKEWQFIPTNADGKVRGENAKKLVRKTALRDFHRNNRLDRMSKLGTNQSEAPRSHDLGSTQVNGQPTSAPSNCTFQSQWESSLDLQWRATLLDIGPAVAFDPFMSTVFFSNREYINLFTRFVYRISPEIQPLGQDVGKNPFNVVFARNALSDPMVLSSLLYHASVHEDSRSSATLIHEGETVRQLALRLENPLEAASDNAIGTVAFLAATGNITGDVERELIHWNALQRMVKMRGGLPALGWNGALAMLLSIGDIIGATITYSKPRLDPPMLLSDQVDTSLGILTTPYLINPDTASLQLEINTLIQLISKLASRFLECNNTLTSSIAVIMYYTQVLSAIEHRILSLEIPYLLGPPLNNAVQYTIEMSKIAALISTTYYFRGMKITSATTTSLQRRLVEVVQTLEFIPPEALEEGSLKLILWACWMGGLTALDQEWFAIRMHGYMTWLELRSWEELESCLEGFVLEPKPHDLHGNSFWPRVSRHFIKPIE